MTDAPIRLQMRDVVAGYGRSDVVLDGLSLDVRSGKVTVVLGPNGSGKSTTLKAIYGMIEVRSGAIELDGEDLTKVPTHRMLERSMALLPQGPSVCADLSVAENLLIGGWIFGHDRRRVEEALERSFEQYPVLAQRRRDHAGTLSGGQRRILEIARLMYTDPELLLIDEPSVGLAPNLVDDVYDEIERLRASGKTLLLVDQNVQAAIDLADYVYILEYGQNKAEGVVGDFAGDVGAIVKDWLRI